MCEYMKVLREKQDLVTSAQFSFSHELTRVMWPSAIFICCTQQTPHILVPCWHLQMKLVYLLDLEHSVTAKTLIGNKTLDGPVVKNEETVWHVILLDDLYNGNRSDVSEMTRFYNRTNQTVSTQLSSIRHNQHTCAD